MADWFTQGYQGLAIEEQRRASAVMPQRFWMKTGDKRILVFVDGAPFAIYEHQATINSDFRNWFTCMSGVYDDDVVCCSKLGNKSKYFIGYYTIIDTAKNTDKKGVDHPFEMRLFGAKTTTMGALKDRQENRGLASMKYEVARLPGDKVPVVGNRFDPIESADLVKAFEFARFNNKSLVQLWDEADADKDKLERLKLLFQLKFDGDGRLVREVVPFNYMSLLAPKTPKEMKILLANAEVKAPGAKSGSGSPTGEGSDDIPF